MNNEHNQLANETRKRCPLAANSSRKRESVWSSTLFYWKTAEHNDFPPQNVSFTVHGRHDRGRTGAYLWGVWIGRLVHRGAGRLGRAWSLRRWGRYIRWVLPHAGSNEAEDDSTTHWKLCRKKAHTPQLESIIKSQNPSKGTTFYLVA